MSNINNRITKLPNNKGRNTNSISKKTQNTIKQINSKKLVNNFVEKYNNNNITRNNRCDSS